jgi:hypothetical protein
MRTSTLKRDILSPRNLWSLGEIMKHFPADGLVPFVANLESILSDLSASQYANNILSDEWKKQIQEHIIREAQALSEYVGLKMIWKQTERLDATLSVTGVTYSAASEALRNLRTRVEDELALCQFVQVEQPEFYLKPELFGEQAGKIFPLAQFDIEESGNCIALGRYTAAVFHLMRVVEVGLGRLAIEVGMSNPVTISDRNWGKILKKIHDAIEAKTTADASWNRAFFESVETILHSVKVSWRNPVMHVEGTYTEDQAQDIFQVVRSFMRSFASGLS